MEEKLLARMIEKSDFKVDWGNEAIKISQKIKGLYPRANTNFRGKNLKILKIKVLSSDEIKMKNTFSIAIIQDQVLFLL